MKRHSSPFISSFTELCTPHKPSISLLLLRRLALVRGRQLNCQQLGAMIVGFGIAVRYQSIRCTHLQWPWSSRRRRRSSWTRTTTITTSPQFRSCFYCHSANLMNDWLLFSRQELLPIPCNRLHSEWLVTGTRTAAINNNKCALRDMRHRSCHSISVQVDSPPLIYSESALLVATNHIQFSSSSSLHLLLLHANAYTHPLPPGVE